jgi:glutamate--cysteine ligase catalytic subunit
MEVGVTDFENAAYTVFIVLVSRVILAFDLNLYIPLSKVDENMDRAHRRNAATSERFWFRATEAAGELLDGREGVSSVIEMSVDEILNGKKGTFPGLLPLIFAYLDEIHCDPETMGLVRSYMELIQRRASGELLTPAAWMRSFVTAHPEYRQDSVVPPGVAHDLVQAIADISEGRRQEPRLMGRQHIPPLRIDDAWPTPLGSPKIGNTERDALLAKYAQRRDLNAETGARATMSPKAQTS